MNGVYPGSFSVNIALPGVSLRPANPVGEVVTRRALLLAGRIPLAAQTQEETDLLFAVAAAKGRVQPSPAR